MASSQDDDMYLFQSGMDQTPGAFAGQDFDSFLASTPVNTSDTSGFMNPNDLNIKREKAESAQYGSNAPRSSRSSASSSSSNGSYPARNISTATSNTTAGNNQGWGSGINGLSMPAADQYYGDASMSGLDQDFDVTDEQMESAFDFATAASTPSGFDSASMATMKASAAAQPFRRTPNLASFGQQKTASPRLPVGQPQFYMSSREASPLNAMLPQSTAQSPWTKHSPSSGLEETFNHITMNGDSPGNATFSPNMQYNPNGFTYEPDSSGTPSSFNKEMTSPPSTIHSGDGSPHLTIHPTSLKSRVETQIPIKMVLYPLPPGAKKLRLPTHTVSKPKFLAKPEVDRSSEILELYTSLVCTSAMQDPVRLERALARARGEDLSSYARPSPASSNGSHSSKEDDEKPLNGGEVRICSGCIQRERKRASRKKQKKPEEEEMFQKDEEKRVVVFNTSEIKDWVEVTKDNQQPGEIVPPSPPGALQVELPMRIACYCRHQNEKMGFQVIFTIKDSREKVIAQAMTNSIMITDDHKTHNPPPSVQNPQMAQLPNAPQLPGAGVFSTSGLDLNNGPPSGTKLFKQSFSTTDLHGLQHNFNPHFPMSPASNPFAIPGPMSAATSATMTPRNLSRPASPTGPTGPSKRRKQSGSGKLPSGLTMTRLDTSHVTSGSATMPNTAASSPYAPNMPSFMTGADRSFTMSNPRTMTYGTSPPTPNGNDQNLPTNVTRTYSLENLPRQALISAPPSRQPSRPGSPRQHSNRNSFGSTDPSFSQAVSSSLMGQPSRRPPPIIHKLVPAEGSVTGGTEVTLLGNGFYQGLEVMFGDTEATTTTFWGEKCLNCIAPPAIQPGVVAVMFKHEHPQFAAIQQQSQTRQSFFTYIDDREIEILRLALRTIGKQMHNPTDDPYSAAQQLLQNQPQPQQGMWPQHSNYGMSGGHQRQAFATGSTDMDVKTLETCLMSLLMVISQPGSRSQLHLRRPSGMSMLHLAASLGMGRFVRGLLSAGANANMFDNCGHSPMHHAAMHGHEEIVRTLRLGGASHQVRSLRNFMPADLATTRAAYQAATRPVDLRRSRSFGESVTMLHSHEQSPSPTNSECDQSPAEQHESGCGGSDDGHATPLRSAEKPLPFAQPDPVSDTQSRGISRRGSVQPLLSSPSQFHRSTPPPDVQPDSPGALLQAWRQLLTMTNTQQQLLAEQIQHIQETLPDPVARRMSSLFPQRPPSAEHLDSSGQSSSWWDTLKINSPASPAPPPAYEELYPSTEYPADDLAVKKSSAMQAAADSAIDDYYDERSGSRTNKPTLAPASGMLDRSTSPKVEFMKDRKLFFFWIPILAIVLCLMLQNSGMIDILPDVATQVQPHHVFGHREGVPAL